MAGFRKQFRVLYRAFLSRVVDLESLPDPHAIQKLAVQFTALLAGISFVIAVYEIPQYSLSNLPRTHFLATPWGDEEFLIATAMAIAGLMAVLAWNTVLPARQDVLVLGPLPLPRITIALARSAALVSLLAVALLALNCFTGLCFPFVLVPANGNAIRSFCAYWVTMAGAGAFVFCALLAVQGLAALLLGYRMFLRISGFLQLAAFFLILAVYFLKPPLANPDALTAPSSQRLLDWLPSYWFLGLFQELNGPTHAIFGPLAGRALRALSLVLAVAAGSLALAYRRSLRGLMEQPDILPVDCVRPIARLTGYIVQRAGSRPLERAIILFTARTLARSRQHRLLLAAYAGIGLAIALAYARSYLYGYAEKPWNRANVPFLAGGFVLLFFAVVGARAVFALPSSLRSNWVFRVTAVHRPSAYFAAVRKSLFGIAAAVWIGCAILYLAIWPGRPAFESLVLLGLVGALFVWRALFKVRKIPFACSYLPGKANLHVSLFAYGILFLFLIDSGSHLELWAIERPARYLPLFAVLLAGALWARHRTAEFAASPQNRLQFDDLPSAEVFALDLRGDGAWLSDEAYVDAIDPHRGRALLPRMRPFLMGALILVTSGVIYERVGERQDRARFPQVGQSFDIGRRSLNIDCQGHGDPVVIFEGNWGEPGYAWAPIQREIAKFTRACWYDRAGYGWSDPGPFPHHSDSVARDLHKLLAAAAISPPYVLVGKSMGAFHVRVYDGFYPGETAGMVLVDPMNEDMTIHIHNHIETFRPVVVSLFRFAAATGVWRLLESEPDPAPQAYTPAEWRTLWHLEHEPKSIAAQPMEPPLWVNGEMARASGALGNLPLIVLSAGRPGTAEDVKLENEALKLELHKMLARRSTRGKQVIVDCGHEIISEKPDAVVAAIREVLKQIRALSGQSRVVARALQSSWGLNLLANFEEGDSSKYPNIDDCQTQPSP